MSQLATLPKKTKWQRASRPKVRTGCLTCIPGKYSANKLIQYSKVRHLKCDEEKPTCRRCRDSRVKCDGYAIPVKYQIQHYSSRAVTEPSIVSFNPCVADTSIESHYFYHFHQWTSAQLTCSSGSSNLYLTYILPLAHTSEPIKYAITAVGAAHRLYLAGQETCSPLSQLKSLAMQQYNKAISHIIPHMSLNSAFDLQCALVCCLLFIAFEGITGRYAESIRHIRAGTRLLSSPALIDNLKERKIIRKITEIFSNLGVEASLFMEDTIIPNIRSGCLDVLYGADISGQPFRNLDEAASVLRKLDVLSVDIMSRIPCPDTPSDSYKYSLRKMDDSVRAELKNMWNKLKNRFQIWSARFELTKKRITIWEYQDLQSPQLIYLTLQQQFWRLYMTWEWEKDCEPLYETVETFLNSAEVFSQRVLTPGQPSFSLEGDLVSSLSLVIWTCSDEHLRSRALNLLRSLNRREGIWDSGEIAEMHEATLALEDYKAWYKKEIPGGVPGFVAELGVITVYRLRLWSGSIVIIAAGNARTIMLTNH
ncbi:uncharacterized protein FTOL_08309 [Fusarium torulosum]|uniref:Zn(2)-C6 fungal-type domain-containing protein n=1 Tax=Fusarium torulosum TaxID=33205 RepID=A0AAE8MDK2_9HYPO|nr:uncharacterized protein FTOL_08309 [Fusarium torulosum]